MGSLEVGEERGVPHPEEGEEDREAEGGEGGSPAGEKGHRPGDRGVEEGAEGSGEEEGEGDEGSLRPAAGGGEPLPGVVGRGALEEQLYLLAHLLNLEEHLAEVGDLESAVKVRELRREALDELALSVAGRPAAETGLRAAWCIVKHALLASYHAYEAALMLRSPRLAGLSRELWGLAVAALEEALKRNA